MEKKNQEIYTFVDISIEGDFIGRIVFELSPLTPKTSENFRALCTGEKGRSESGVLLHYKNCVFDRIAPECFIQGGDIQHRRGTVGESIYGKYFDDENFLLSHSQRGTLSMGNTGPHTNGSYFCITTTPCEWLDCKHVAFGKVISGMDVVDVICQKNPHSGFASLKITISDCGQL